MATPGADSLPIPLEGRPAAGHARAPRRAAAALVSRAAPCWAARHLLSAGVAVVVVAAVLLGGWRDARSVEDQQVGAVASLVANAKLRSMALDAAAFRRSDLLPWYGASELAAGRTNNARLFFAAEPTGFAVYSMARGGGWPLNYLQEVAAMGSDLRGKSVVISVDPGQFTTPTPDRQEYAGSFSYLAAAELVWSLDLSTPLKQQAAQRMLLYPDTLRPHPLLYFATRALADTSPGGRALYAASLPLGRLYVFIARLQNHWDTLRFLRHTAATPPPAAGAPDWASLLARADRSQRIRALGNPLGMDAEAWTSKQALIQQRKGRWTDTRFRAALQRSQNWLDLELLLRALKGLGARPLLLGMPTDGRFYAWEGISPTGQGAYYARLAALAARYDVPLDTFADREDDPYFFFDWVHPSQKGWLSMDRAVDNFYHGRRP